MKIAIYGFMGAGKTGLGKALAERLGIPFVDLDEEIEKDNKLSINEIFDNHGEIAFRKTEHKILKKIVKHSTENIILSLGGGSILQPVNRRILQLSGFKTVYLNVDINELIQRLKNDKDKRPLLKNIDDDKFEQYVTALYESRKKIYEKYAETEIKIYRENFETTLERLYLYFNFN